MILTALQEKFILHWGEMGTRWGINRSVAQIHALLYISKKPMNADEIMETLSIARSNVSTSLKELQSWNIVKVVHVLGDRRDHFESVQDVWTLFQIIVEERKRREIDPTLAILRECVHEAKKSPQESHTHERLSELLNFCQTMTDWFNQLNRLPQAGLKKFIKLGSKINKLFP